MPKKLTPKPVVPVYPATWLSAASNKLSWILPVYSILLTNSFDNSTSGYSYHSKEGLAIQLTNGYSFKEDDFKTFCNLASAEGIEPNIITVDGVEVCTAKFTATSEAVKDFKSLVGFKCPVTKYIRYFLLKDTVLDLAGRFGALSKNDFLGICCEEGYEVISGTTIKHLAALFDLKSVKKIAANWHISEDVGYFIVLTGTDAHIVWEESESIEEGFKHEPLKLTAKKMEEFEVELGELLDEVNRSAEDPYFNPDSEGEELSFRVGSEEEMTATCELVLKALTKVNGGEFSTYVYSSTEDESEHLNEDGVDGLEESNCKVDPKMVEELLGAVISHYGPTGYCLEYNDGAYHQRSGYSESSHTIDISTVSAGSEHEHIGCQVKLLEWLVETNLLGLSPAQIKKNFNLDI